MGRFWSFLLGLLLLGVCAYPVDETLGCKREGVVAEGIVIGWVSKPRWSWIDVD